MMCQRAFLLFLTCLVFTSLAVLLLPSRHGASFNKETQEKIYHLSDNLISDETSQDLLAPNPVYLTILGLECLIYVCTVSIKHKESLSLERQVSSTSSP